MLYFLRCLLLMLILSAQQAAARESALFATVDNQTQQTLLLQHSSSSMHALVGHKILPAGEVFIAKFEHPDRVVPYLIYSLKNALQIGKCYLKPQRNLEPPRCVGQLSAQMIYLGENSYEFILSQSNT
jgi:hypothetical protein